MASKLAKQFLRDNGIEIPSKANDVEIGNFCAGRGRGRCELPYHIVMLRKETGDSKTTVDWAPTLEMAREILCNLRATNDGSRGYYIRDVRNNRSIR